MGAPKGNQFWKLRAKHGRDKLFATPELLWEAACEYFEWCEQNPILKQDFKGKDADLVNYELDIPFTLTGLCLYLGTNQAYFRQFKDSLTVESGKKQTQIQKDFSTVITRIEETIYTQKYNGAAVGIFNANIIARDLGLKEQTDVTSKGDKLEPTAIVFKDFAK